MPNPLLAALCVVVIFLPFLLGPLIVMITDSAAGIVIGCIGWVLSLGITMLLYMYSFEQNPAWWNNHGVMPIAVIIAIIVAAISAIMIFVMMEEII
jgi:branched-subunit amino acid transport protein AzlD